MTEVVRLYTGTRTGLHIFDANEGDCHQVGEAFHGETILAVAGDQVGRVFVALRNGPERQPRSAPIHDDERGQPPGEAGFPR